MLRVRHWVWPRKVLAVNCRSTRAVEAWMVMEAGAWRSRCCGKEEAVAVAVAERVEVEGKKRGEEPQVQGRRSNCSRRSRFPVTTLMLAL